MNDRVLRHKQHIYVSHRFGALTSQIHKNMGQASLPRYPGNSGAFLIIEIQNTRFDAKWTRPSSPPTLPKAHTVDLNAPGEQQAPKNYQGKSYVGLLG